MDGCRSRLASLALTRWSTLPTFPLIRLPHWFLSVGSCCLPNLVRATSNFTLNQNTAHLPPSKPRTVVSTFGWFSPAVNSHNRGFHLLQRLQRYGVLCAASNRLCLLPSTTTNGAGISPQRKWTYSPPRLRPQTRFTRAVSDGKRSRSASFARRAGAAWRLTRLNLAVKLDAVRHDRRFQRRRHH